MPYVYEDKAAGGPDVTDRVKSSTRRVLEEQFATSFEENPIMAVSRWAALEQAKQLGPKLTKDQAVQRLNLAGMSGALAFDDNGISEEAFNTLVSRKRVEQRRAQIFNRARGGVLEGAGRLGVALGTSVVDPVNVGLAFVPLVGQAKYIAALKASKSALGRAGIRARVGAIEGVAGAAAVEPLIYGSRHAEQYDYDAIDSLMNVSFGAIFGGALHPTVGGIGDVFARGTDVVPPAKGPKELLDRTAEQRQAEPTIEKPPTPLDADALTNQILSTERMRQLVEWDHQKNRQTLNPEEKTELREMGVTVKDGEPMFPAKSPEEVERTRLAVGQSVLDEPVNVVPDGEIVPGRVQWREQLEQQLRTEGVDYVDEALEGFDEMVAKGTPESTAFAEFMGTEKMWATLGVKPREPLGSAVPYPRGKSTWLHGSRADPLVDVPGTESAAPLFPGALHLTRSAEHASFFSVFPREGTASSSFGLMVDPAMRPELEGARVTELNVDIPPEQLFSATTKKIPFERAREMLSQLYKDSVIFEKVLAVLKGKAITGENFMKLITVSRQTGRTVDGMTPTQSLKRSVRFNLGADEWTNVVNSLKELGFRGALYRDPAPTEELMGKLLGVGASKKSYESLAVFDRTDLRNSNPAPAIARMSDLTPLSPGKSISEVRGEDPEPQLAIEQAEVTMKDVPEDPAEAIDDDLATAESDLREAEQRLAPEETEPDPEIVEMDEAVTTAERWAKASEIAETCLTRSS